MERYLDPQMHSKTVQNIFLPNFSLNRYYVSEKKRKKMQKDSHSSGFTITLVMIQFWNAFFLSLHNVFQHITRWISSLLPVLCQDAVCVPHT